MKSLTQSQKNQTNRRAVLYILVFVGLILLYISLRDSAWAGSTQLHTVMEVLATALATFVGVLALIRYYTKKTSIFLFIGTGFIGTALLDGYHAVVTSSLFSDLFPSVPGSLIPWSWVASRFFLSALLLLSWYAWRREKKHRKIFKERTVFGVVAIFTLASFLFFAFSPLPRAYYPELFFGRPEEFIPALFFLLALIGYLFKGAWKTDYFEHWLVLSLIVGFVTQAVFMSFSFSLFDFEFDAAHLLKKVSYVLTLIGLLISMFYLFRSEEELKKKILKQNSKLTSSKQEMEKKKNEFEQLNKIMMGRESRIVELKDENKKLKEKPSTNSKERGSESDFYDSNI
ncbi:hypothetical protein COB87_001570 [Candidatus Wolfebacteria bacterium]|nr:hypothetical protein [Candidatus Wolfebacteria bacterium]